jgi:signal transduction histidine kinase
MYDYITHIWLFLSTSIFVSALAVYAVHFRDMPGATPYAIHKAAITFLLLSLIMASVSTQIEEKIFWIKLYNICTFIAVPAWLALTLQLTGHYKLLNGKSFTGTFLIFLFAVVSLFINNEKGWYFNNIWTESNNIRATEGMLGTVVLMTGYGILLVCTFLFINRYMKVKGILRTQTSVIIFSTFITLCGHFCWRFAPIPELRQDSLAIAFVVSGLLDAFALFRLRMFDIMAVAQATVTKNMGDGLIVLDKKELIVGLNPSAEKIIFKSNPEFLGNHAAKIFDKWPELSHLITKSDSGCCELLLDQQYYHILSVPLYIRNNRRLGTALLFHNITDEKKSQQLLLEQQQALAVLKERDRLGRELHDGRGQLLSFFQMQLETARTYIAKGHYAQVEPILKQLVDNTLGLHTDIRESITALKNTSHDESFLHTLNDYLSWFSQNYEIKTDLAVIGEYEDEMLSPIAVIQLQRIIQEALTNVRKHAYARNIHVSIELIGNVAEILIKNDGIGFDVEKAMLQKGKFGLHIMHERSEEIGAHLNFVSNPDTGTIVTIRVPIKQS